MMIFEVLFLCALLAAFVLFTTNYPSYKRRQKLLEGIPSPKGLPILGHSLEISSSYDIFHKLNEWTNSLGKLFKLVVGPLIIYVTSDIDLIEHIMSSSSLITKARFYHFAKPWLGNSLLITDGERWFKKRKAITPSFHFKILEQFIQKIDKHAEIFVKTLRKEVGKDSVEISHLLSFCTLDVISDTSMGVELNAQMKNETQYVKAINFLQTNAMTRTYSILGQNDFIYSLTPTCWEEKRQCKIAHDFTLSVIKKRREELQNCGDENKNFDDNFGIKEKRAFLDMLLQANIDGRPLTDDEIREEVDTFMYAGHDTTAYTLSFILYNLAKCPEVQSKLYDEINAFYSKGEKEESSKIGEIQSLKYMDCVIKESMRVFPTVPYVGREFEEDFEFNGKTFLKGSNIMLNIYAIHHDEEHYKNPHEFNPDRWLNHDEKRHPFAFIPFSAGPRNCIGQRFAILEMKCLLSKIILNYEICPSKPEVELKLCNEAVLKSMTGIHISIKNR